jgi:hypothetical protein
MQNNNSSSFTNSSNSLLSQQLNQIDKTMNFNKVNTTSSIYNNTNNNNSFNSSIQSNNSYQKYQSLSDSTSSLSSSCHDHSFYNIDPFNIHSGYRSLSPNTTSTSSSVFDRLTSIHNGPPSPQINNSHSLDFMTGLSSRHDILPNDSTFQITNTDQQNEQLFSSFTAQNSKQHQNKMTSPKEMMHNQENLSNFLQLCNYNSSNAEMKDNFSSIVNSFSSLPLNGVAPSSSINYNDYQSLPTPSQPTKQNDKKMYGSIGNNSNRKQIVSSASTLASVNELSSVVNLQKQELLKCNLFLNFLFFYNSH